MDAVILAAGLSSRAKDYKMTMQIEGRYVLYHTLDAFVNICEHIYVVTGHEASRIETIIQDYEYRELVTCVHNKDYLEGMFSSIQVGVEQTASSYFYMTPGDYPMIMESTVLGLKKEVERCNLETSDLKTSDLEVIIPSCHFKSGHPILIHHSVKERILNKPKTYNLRKILSTCSKHYLNVDDQGILIDLDTPKHFQVIQLEFHNKQNK